MLKKLTSSQYLKYAYELYSELEATEINLMYEGAVTQETALSFTSMAEQNLVRLKEPSQVQRKVFNVMVESVQNISRHADVIGDDPNEVRRGIIAISHSQSEYQIVTGNIIKNAKKDILANKLDVVNAADRAQLSEMYKKQIRDGHISEKGGAGLGFIDIAKKSGNPISYKFFDIGEGYCFFMTIVRIARVVESK